MKNKKSFLLYLDQQDLFNKLPDEIAGKLIKHIFSYVNRENPEANDLLLEVAFSSIKQSLKRDLNKWESQLKQRSDAGKKSAEKRAKEKQRKATTVKSRSTKSTDSVNVSVSDSVSDNEVTKDIVAKARKYSDVDYQFAEYAYSLITKVAPKQKANLNSWAETVRLMREVDNINHQDMADVFRWSNSDSFWSTNILSMTKLRKQFPQLQAKMKGVNNERAKNTSQKLSAHERVKQRNDAKYRQPDECGLGMGANDGHMGRAVDEGERGATIEHMDSGTFIDYE